MGNVVALPNNDFKWLSEQGCCDAETKLRVKSTLNNLCKTTALLYFLGRIELFA